MLQSRISAGIAEASSFLQDKRGNTAVLFAFALVPLLGAVGVALDYSRANSLKAQLQVAVDETALRSFDMAEEARLQSAQLRLASLGVSANDVSVTGNIDDVTVSALRKLPTTALAVLGIKEISVAARARAAAASRGAKACLLALSQTASNAVSFSGSSSYVGKDCAVHSNSRDPNGLSIGGNSRPIANGFCSVGGASAPTDFTPPPKSRCRPVKDPFAEVIKPPEVGACNFNNVNVGPQQDVVLKPGVYCGGLTVRGTARLDPNGVYIFKDGELSVNSQGSLYGEGVFFYLTGSKSGFTINGGGDVRVSAAKDGDYGGVLIYQDPASNPGTENRLNGSSTTVIDGAIYTPANGVRVNGSSGFGQESVYMPIIADTITITGSTAMRIDLDDIDMIAPIPEMSQMVRLVE
jgi:Flp pilus assembly protein TadG